MGTRYRESTKRLLNELSDQYSVKHNLLWITLAQSIHYHSVGMIVALELHFLFYKKIVLKSVFVEPFRKKQQNFN